MTVSIELKKPGVARNPNRERCGDFGMSLCRSERIEVNSAWGSHYPFGPCYNHAISDVLYLLYP